MEATFSVLRAERLYNKILEMVEASIPGDVDQDLLTQVPDHTVMQKALLLSGPVIPVSKIRRKMKSNALKKCDLL